MFAIEWNGKMKGRSLPRQEEGISSLYGPILRAGLVLSSPTPRNIPHRHKLALQNSSWQALVALVKVDLRCRVGRTLPGTVIVIYR